jgi:hypothetical protein
VRHDASAVDDGEFGAVGRCSPVNATSAPTAYVTSLDEVFWGVMLIALTMAVHGFGVIVTLRAGGRLQERLAGRPTFLSGISTLIIATWILVVVHLVEVMIWASFLVTREAFLNFSTAFYYALMQYTTVGSEFSLPDRLRLLGGMIAMAGLLTFAWSTSVLFMLAQSFQAQQLAPRRHGPSSGATVTKTDASRPPGAG